ncbi:otogelin-like protein [Brienomyrus brachyistius]|uniref:otogelin-like protein n=1 Tax=Brienomyrus brachyistius TaxID=42636 RepID=UPI0020B2C41F|nr:otogelin-like protein [Brienomyrus brachyistius]
MDPYLGLTIKQKGYFLLFLFILINQAMSWSADRVNLTYWHGLESRSSSIMVPKRDTGSQGAKAVLSAATTVSTNTSSSSEEVVKPSLRRATETCGVSCLNGGSCSNANSCNCSLYQATGIRCQTVPNLGMEREMTCRTWGQYNYETFDGLYYHFPGRCTYTLVRDCEETTQSSIVIQVHNDPDCPRSPSSCARSVSLFLPWEGEIRLQKHEVTLRGQSLELPHSVRDVELERISHYILVTHPHGFTLAWEGHSSSVYIKMSPEYVGRTCGLCGNFNADVQDDLKTSYGVFTEDLAVFGNSWMDVDPQRAACPLVPSRYPSPCSALDPDTLQKVTEVCASLLEDPFKICHEFVSPFPYMASCSNDLCLLGLHNEAVCQVLTEYARACAHAERPLEGWRDHMPQCVVSCPPELIYQECISCCPVSCSVDRLCIDSKLQCLDGCYCGEGEIYKNGSCMKASDCPCEHHGMVYLPGQTIREECNTCTCLGGLWNCSEHSCPGECSVTGDINFETFDGRLYTFHATCQYVLAKSRNSGRFTVTIQNAPCGPNLDGACIQSVTVVMDEDPKTEVTMTHGGEVFVAGQYRISLPYLDEVFHIQELSSMFLQVRAAHGLLLQYNWGEFRLYLQVDESWKDDTVGLCGTFNGNSQDDFLSPSGMIESTPPLFGNSWKLSSACVQSPSVPQLDPCDTHQQAASYAAEMCELLNQAPFAACHALLSPLPFQQRCRADTCKCGRPCLCSALAGYARSCRRHGVTVDFRAGVPDCAVSCPETMVYGTCVSSCQRHCPSAAVAQHCGGECEEGCVCALGTFYNSRTRTCVDRSRCPCVFLGAEYAPGDVVLSSSGVHVCRDGKMVPQSSDVDKTCPPGQLYHDCADLDGVLPASKGVECEQTCETYLLNLTCSAHEPCIPGCICPLGLLRHGDECFEPEACPCVWKGKEFFPGDKVTSPCHHCVCQHGAFQCEFRPCPSMCTAYGDRHYKTFDGLQFDYIGACKVYLLKSDVDASVSVTAENVDCFDSGVICRKSLVISIGESIVAFDDDSGKPNPTSLMDSQQGLFIWRAGYFTILHVPSEDLTVMWDTKTTVHIQAGPRWQGKLAGLCGNYDLKTVNEMRTPENIESATPQEFGNSWTTAECVNSPDIRHPCSLSPLREPFAKRQCGILLSEVFQLCHPVVDVTWFYMNCLTDTCGCSRGGDCECFCTSVSAYAHRCCQLGVSVDWRSPAVCPYDCEFYNKVLGKGPFRLVTYRERDTLLAVNSSGGVVFSLKGVSPATGVTTLFMMTPGLSRARPHDPSLVSFEAAERPNFFLCVGGDGVLQLAKWEDSEQFWDESTYVLHRDTWISGYDSLESFAVRGHFLHSAAPRVRLAKYSHSASFRRSILFRLMGTNSGTSMGPRCQWRYETCFSACFRTCSDPYGQTCTTIPKVEGCLPQCPGHMVLDEVTQRCVHLEDCIRPAVAVEAMTPRSTVEAPAAVTSAASASTAAPSSAHSISPATPMSARSEETAEPGEPRVTTVVEVLTPSVIPSPPKVTTTLHPEVSTGSWTTKLPADEPELHVHPVTSTVSTLRTSPSVSLDIATTVMSTATSPVTTMTSDSGLTTANVSTLMTQTATTQAIVLDVSHTSVKSPEIPAVTSEAPHVTSTASISTPTTTGVITPGSETSTLPAEATTKAVSSMAAKHPSAPTTSTEYVPFKTSPTPVHWTDRVTTSEVPGKPSTAYSTSTTEVPKDAFTTTAAKPIVVTVTEVTVSTSPVSHRTTAVSDTPFAVASTEKTTILPESNATTHLTSTTETAAPETSEVTLLTTVIPTQTTAYSPTTTPVSDVPTLTETTSISSTVTKTEKVTTVLTTSPSSTYPTFTTSSTATSERMSTVRLPVWTTEETTITTSTLGPTVSRTTGAPMSIAVSSTEASIKITTTESVSETTPSEKPPALRTTTTIPGYPSSPQATLLATQKVSTHAPTAASTPTITPESLDKTTLHTTVRETTSTPALSLATTTVPPLAVTGTTGETSKSPPVTLERTTERTTRTLPPASLVTAVETESTRPSLPDWRTTTMPSTVASPSTHVETVEMLTSATSEVSSTTLSPHTAATTTPMSMRTTKVPGSTTVPSAKMCTPPYSEIIDECTKYVCVGGQLILFNKSQNCPFKATPPNCGLLGFAILVNGDKCCPLWACPCRCSVFPDLNVITFDGNSVAVYKAASYIVSQLPNETVSILVRECRSADSVPSKFLWNFTNLCLVALNITHNSHQVLLNRLQRRLYVNSRYAKPRLKKHGFEVLDTGNMYLIRTPAGLKMQWFHSTGMMVIETEGYNNKLPTMGLCGCCDGSPANDLTLSNGTALGKGEDPAVFIDSWQLPNTTSYISHSRRREVNCSTSDCSRCLDMLRNSTFRPCHTFVPPSVFCEVWVRDEEYVKNPCVSLAAYVASCHKFNICVKWRSPDFCPFACPPGLRYQGCLPACTAQSCPNQEFDSEPEECSGLTEGCVCPEGMVLHRPYSALCIPSEKCACTDSSGNPRALGEVWTTSKDGCCMYKCDNDSIVPVEYDCTDVPQPVCRRMGEVAVSLADDKSCCPQKACVCNQTLCESYPPQCKYGEKLVSYFREDSCCPEYICECDPSRCESDVPTCREDQTLIATRADGSCCLAYICMCGPCVDVIPQCQEGEVLTVDTNSTERCCPAYHCVCEPYRCPKVTCLPGMSEVTVPSPGRCCPLQTCECACDIIPRPKCHLGETLQVDRVFLTDPGNKCGCKRYKCEREAVCVDGERGVMRPGQTLVEHSPEGVCYTTQCTHALDTVTGFFRTRATSRNCSSQCQPNQVYVPPKDQMTCCGFCKNISCMYTNENGSVELYKPGRTWVSDCLKYECTDTLSGPTLVSYPFSCPPFNESECIKIGGTILSYMGGCCRTCTGLSLFPFPVSPLTPTVSTDCERGKEDGKSCQKVTVRMTIRKNDCRSNRPVNIVSCDGKCPSASIYNYNINTYARFCKCCREVGLQKRSVQLFCSGNSTWVTYAIQEPTDCSCQWS